MKPETKRAPETQLLELLKQVLPKATADPKLAGRIYAAVESELKAKARVKAFEQFCKKTMVRDLESQSLEDVRTRLAQSFADSDVTLRPNRKEKSLTIEVALPDGHRFANTLEVNPNAPQASQDESETPTPFVPFPVCLPGDPELVWVLVGTKTFPRKKLP